MGDNQLDLLLGPPPGLGESPTVQPVRSSAAVTSEQQADTRLLFDTGLRQETFEQQGFRPAEVQKIDVVINNPINPSFMRGDPLPGRR